MNLSQHELLHVWTISAWDRSEKEGTRALNEWRQQFNQGKSVDKLAKDSVETSWDSEEGKLSVLFVTVYLKEKEKCWFVNYLCAYGIVKLLESLCNSSSEVDLSGYTCSNLYRKFKHTNARRNSVSIVVYYKNSIRQGMNIVINKHDTSIWLHLKKEFFRLQSVMCLHMVWKLACI